MEVSMHIIIKRTKTIEEYKELHTRIESLAIKVFNNHKKAFGEWKEGNVKKVWLDNDKTLCIEYQSGNWWHYNEQGEWW